jgi:hypothetical protein
LFISQKGHVPPCESNFVAAEIRKLSKAIIQWSQFKTVGSRDARDIKTASLATS